MTGLTHIGPRGEAHMVDVSAKPDSARLAVARGRVVMARETLAVAGSEKKESRTRNEDLDFVLVLLCLLSQ